MTWVKLDDSFGTNPKVAKLSNGAFRLHVLALCHCARHLTDGLVSRPVLRFLGGTVKVAEELVEAGLWETEADGYLIHDYLEYNPSRASVEESREADAERKRRGRESRWSPNGIQAESGRNPAGFQEAVRAESDRPVPSPSSKGSSRGGETSKEAKVGKGTAPTRSKQ